MYQVRASLLRWGVTGTLVFTLCALFVTPTLAGGELILRHSVVSGTSSFVAFGPVGPNCSATTAGSDCTFFTSSFKGSGNAVPGGPFTVTGTTTELLGPFSTFPFVSVSGAVNASTGTPTGGCAPIFQTSHVVFANGTIDQNAQGNSCCASSSCADFLGGPPTTSHTTQVCISGTGKFAGIQCSGESSGSSSDNVHFVARGEGVSTK